MEIKKNKIHIKIKIVKRHNFKAGLKILLNGTGINLFKK